MTFFLSPSTLETASCLARYRYYKLLHRRSADIRSGADAGICVHKGFRGIFANRTQEEQEKALLEARAKLPLAEMDYRHGDYLVAALAQLRAEVAPLVPRWEILEVERKGERPLGAVEKDAVHPNWFKRLEESQWSVGGHVTVVLKFVRDVVLRDDGRVVIGDLKTSSRDESAGVAYFQNSGQFKAYTWAWNNEHPNDRASMVQPIRLVMRAPSKTGVTYSVKIDPPVRFDDSVLAEWHRNAMRRAADFLSRDPDDEADWPMIESGNGTCRNTYGCCDYLSVCTKPPGDRPLKLATDVFVDARLREAEESPE